MAIIFNSPEFELDCAQAEEVLTMCNKRLQTYIAKISTATKVYLPRALITEQQLKIGDKLYLTHEFISKNYNENAFKVTVQQARGSMYITFPKRLIRAFKPEPTHIRFTYDDHNNIWKYQLVKKEVM